MGDHGIRERSQPSGVTVILRESAWEVTRRSPRSAQESGGIAEDDVEDSKRGVREGAFCFLPDGWEGNFPLSCPPCCPP